MIRFTGAELVKTRDIPDAFADQVRLLGPGEARTILDVGANVGQTAERYRRYFPGAAIHCFEPFPSSYESLCAATSGDDLIEAHPVVMADSPGKKTFHVCRGDAMNSLFGVGADGDLHMGGPEADMMSEITVDATTVDAFCDERGLERIDILKMDIQGSELLALQGAQGMLGREAIGLIYCEVLFADLYEGGAKFDDVWRFLEGFGYTLYGLYTLERGYNEYLGFCDAIFTAPKIYRDKSEQGRVRANRPREK